MQINLVKILVRRFETPSVYTAGKLRRVVGPLKSPFMNIFRCGVVKVTWVFVKEETMLNFSQEP